MPSSPRRLGWIAFAVAFLLAFPWVDSEWKGGPLQAAGGAAALAMPVGLITWSLVDRSRRGRCTLKVLLGAGVLLSLLGIYSYGVFVTPFFLAPLWVATRRARGPEAVLWVVLAAPCALLTGWLLSSSLEQPDDHVPAIFTAVVVLLFSLTALKQRSRALHRKHGG